jgi:ApaG protein
MTDAYIETTRGIRVTVRSFYLEDQSQPDEGRFVWAYRVTIENQSQQAVLDPGESFEYTSGTPLDTPTGFMGGQYHMIVTTTGENFDVVIPTFSLDSPHQDLRLH